MSEAAVTTAPVETPTAPTGSTVLGSAASPDARAWLPEEYRSDPTFKDLADVSALAKGYKHAASLVGVDKADIVRIPREGEMPADQRAALLSRLGMARPEAPEGYELKAPETVRPEAAQWFTAAAFEAGLSKQQAAALMQGLPQLEQMVASQKQATTEASVAKLKEEWGAAFDQKVARLEQLGQQKMGDGWAQTINALVEGGHLGALNFLAGAADMMLEKPALTGGGRDATAMTPQEAQAKIGALMQDGEFQKKLGNREHADHAEARRQWDELHSWAYSNEPRNRSRPAA